jgi:FtsP/CotA-like multicopper oxidase with cupredoxin domain
MRKLWENKVSRRRLIGGAAVTGAALPVLHEVIPHQGLHGGEASAAEHSARARAGHRGSAHLGAVGRVDPRVNGFDPHEILRDFDEGIVTAGVREWEIVAEDREIEVAPGVKYPAWTYNGRVPGPTLRAREGERLRIRFVNGSTHPHTIHFHGIHRAASDGVPGVGTGNIGPGESTVYEFDATPFGLHLYHCHSTPLADHIAKGLYGAFLIDPKPDRPDADELVMVMNGFDTNFDRSNELEVDPVNSFHVHANFFDYYPTGTRVEPRDFTDTVVQGQGERGILELRFPYTGRYMFHAHVSEFAELGWMGFFEVVD